ncbi:hypothetical protein RND81_10G196500 [Saponaria officinalis]|uniref:VQ domain-containing protein n=1 Tax=Saponaria officinalis TaxID=3572 RepID=A0AAW1I4U7_SAPOF
MKRENNNNNHCNNGMTSSSMKVHKVSHAIKKSSYSSSSSSSSRFVPSLIMAGSKAHHQRGPVIIYTHSPKVIHTNPRDFMALVQKLTGMSGSKDDNDVSPRFKNVTNELTNNKKMTIKMSINDNNSSSTTIDDNESSSVITDENCSSGTTGDVVGHLNRPCMDAPIFNPSIALPQGPLVPGFSFFMNNNESDLGPLCNNGDSPVYDYMNYNFPYYNQIT